MSEFLEPDELKRLTDCAQARKQDEWLTGQGIPHKVVDAGRLIVSRYHLLQWEISGRGAKLRPEWLEMVLTPDAALQPHAGQAAAAGAGESLRMNTARITQPITQEGLGG